MWLVSSWALGVNLEKLKFAFVRNFVSDCLGMLGFLCLLIGNVKLRKIFKDFWEKLGQKGSYGGQLMLR